MQDMVLALLTTHDYIESALYGRRERLNPEEMGIDDTTLHLQQWCAAHWCSKPAR